MKMNVLFLAVALIATGARSTAQAPSGTASIIGIVVADTPAAEPLRNVTLTLQGSSLTTPRLAISTPEGQFAFANLPAGSYTLTALRPGYVTRAYGAMRSWRSPGVPIAVAGGQRVSLQPLRLIRGAVVTGKLTDPSGTPLEDVSVTINEIRTLNGQVTLSTVPALASPPSQAPGSVAITDDRGMYRFFGLPAGTFVVSASRVTGNPLRTFEITTPGEIAWAGTPTGSPAASTQPPAGQPVGHVPIYFPGTPDVSAAQILTLAAGDERGGVDFIVDAVNFAKISGTVTGPSGQPAAGVQVVALRVGTATGAPGPAFPTRGASDQQGSFTLPSAAPGRYTLLAQGRGGAGGPAAFAQTEIAVNGFDVSGVTLQLQPGVSVSGRLVFENRTAPLGPDALQTRVRLTPPPSAGAGPAIPVAVPDETGSFRFDGVAPGSYFLSAAPAGNWMMTRANQESRDLMTSLLEVQAGQAIGGITVNLTDRVTEVSGVLRDQSGRPSPDYYVLIYPADQRQWSMGRERLRPAVRPDAEGRYRVSALPPGEYYMAAVTTMQPNDFADPAFLEVLVPASLKITIAPGEKKIQDVTLASQ
jgi:hypothetical protein